MIWILAIFCIGITCFSGFHQGPIRAGFALAGVILACFLTAPLSPIVKTVLPLIGFDHPVWAYVIPPTVTFIVIVIAFNFMGESMHRKVVVKQKYGEDDARYYRWERMFQRVGLCLGVLTGSVIFFALLVPVYAFGYFTTEIYGEGKGPIPARIVTALRSSLQKEKLDRVVAAYDPLPKTVYTACDTVVLLLKNPALAPKISRYPVVIGLSERPEYRDLFHDSDIQKAYNDGEIGNLVENEKIHKILTSPAKSSALYSLLVNNLADLDEFLKTGKSPKYDAEPIIGNWTLNVPGTVLLDRAKKAYPTVSQTLSGRMEVLNKVYGMRLTATFDNQLILRRGDANSDESVRLQLRGTWKKNGSNYEFTLADNTPGSGTIEIKNGQIQLPRNGVTLVFSHD